VSRLTGVITASDPETRNQSLDALCHGASLEELIEECKALDGFAARATTVSARAGTVLPVCHPSLSHPASAGGGDARANSFPGYVNLLKRRFEEAIDIFLAAQKADGPSAAISSALAAGYRALGFSDAGRPGAAQRALGAR